MGIVTTFAVLRSPAMASAETPALLELDVGPIAAGGGCVARAPDGKVVFVRHTLPGERVRAQVTGETTSYMRADAIEILTPSPDRVTPPCPHSGPGRCGGCDFQHVEVGAQRRLKAFRIAEQLERLAGLDHEVEVEVAPVAGDEDGLGWRSRVRLAVDGRGAVGFRRHRSHRLEYVDDCPIASPGVNASGALAHLWPGAAELEVATGSDPAEAVVAVTPRRRAPLRLPDLGTGVVVSGEIRRAPGAVHATVGARTYRISPGVFWQVHTGAAAALLQAVMTAAGDCTGSSVVDLYAGAGLFSVALADAVGPTGSVLAVERDRRACADARHNGAAFANLRVLEGEVTSALVTSSLGRPAIVVLDPAREGAGTAVMEALLAHAPTVRTVIYVSCEPSSFGRDLRVMLDGGWRLASLRAFDIFPMTEHVELVAVLEPPDQADRATALAGPLGDQRRASGVPAELMLQVAGRLELQRRVRNVEVPRQAVLEMVEDASCLTGREALVGDHHVGRQDRQRRRERPGVQVVDRLHLRQLHEVPPHLLDVDVLGGRLQQNAQGRPQQLHRRLQHQQHDDQGGDGVGPVEAPQHDHDAGYERAGEPVEVGQDVPIRALHVQ